MNGGITFSKKTSETLYIDNNNNKKRIQTANQLAMKRWDARILQIVLCVRASGVECGCVWVYVQLVLATIQK